MPRAQLILNLKPQALADFYVALQRLRNTPALSPLVHSVIISALSRYDKSLTPVVIQLKSKGWQSARMIIQALGLYDASDYVDSHFPGMMKLAQGVHYAEFPAELAARVEASN